MISQVALLLVTPAETLNLFNIVDLEDSILDRVLLKQQCNKDGPLGVGMNATTSVALGESRDEERRTLGRLQMGGGIGGRCDV